MANRRPLPVSAAAGPDPALGRWRVAVGLVVALLVGVPLATPILELVAAPHAWGVWTEAERLFVLARTSAVLAAGTLALALPAGTIAAALLYRTDFAPVRLLRAAIVLAMFVPLPLFASAWQASVSIGGWLLSVGLGPWLGSGSGIWSPWPVGPGAAVAVHALAAFPWVVWIMGQGLRSVERPLEEDALTVAGPARVFGQVTLSRARPYLWAAACWVLLQTQGEIAITDVMQVPTFAEEAYTQMVAGDATAVTRALAASAPVVLGCWALAAATVALLQRRWVPLWSVGPPLLFQLGPAAMVAAWSFAALVGGAAVVPVASLVWKAGLYGAPSRWAADVAAQHIGLVARLRWPVIGASLLEAAAVGLAAAGLALVLAWLSDGSRSFRIATVALCALAWAEPAPVVGFGLKSTILLFARHDPTGLSAALLYDNPSMLPVAWAHLLRFLPFALVLVWPGVRQIPPEVRAVARADGLSPLQELADVVVPFARQAIGRAAVAVAILSLGEVGAAKLVETAGAPTLAHEVFSEMHYGLTNDLAALCTILLLLVAAGGVCLATVQILVRRRPPVDAAR